MFGRKMGFLVVFFVVTSLGMFSEAFAHPDSLVLTPPLGWNSWNVFHENINENQIKEIIRASKLDIAYSKDGDKQAFGV